MKTNGTGRPAGAPGDKTRAFDPKTIARGARTLDLVPQSYDPKERTVELVLSEGAKVDRWYGIEALSVEESAVTVDRLRTSGIPFLDSHDTYGIDKVVGRIVDVWFAGGQILGRAAFGETARAKQAEGMVARGEIKGISIGYRVDAWTISDADGTEIDPEKQNVWAYEGLTFTASRWELLEVSLVSVPADPAAMVRSHERGGDADLRATPMGRDASEITVANGDASITYRFGQAAPRERALPVITERQTPMNTKPKSNASRLERAKGAVSRLGRAGKGAIRAEAPTVDEDGYYVDAEGNYVDADGKAVDEPVKADRAEPDVDDDGYYVDAEGNYVDADGKAVDEPVKADRADPNVDEDGYYVDAEGNYVDADGKAADEPVKADRDGDEEGDNGARAGARPRTRAGKGGKRELTQAQAAELSRIGQEMRAAGVEVDVTKAIERGLSPAALRKIGFDKLAERSRENQVRGTTPNNGGGSRVRVLRDEAEGKRGAMELAMIQRILASGGQGAMDYRPKRKDDQRWVEQHQGRADDYRDFRLVEVAADCIGHRGYIRSAQQAITIMERAYQSTSDFPAIFANVLNKVLLARYEMAEPTYKLISIERPFKDFRPHPMVRAGDFPMLQPVNQAGELAVGGSGDTGENVTLVPYGVVFPITRQMIVNDELGAIDQILGSSGDAVRMFENTTFFAMFNANRALAQDGKPVFDPAHKNVAAAAGPITVNTVGAGRAALRGMKSISGYLLNIPPSIILTGPTQETSADQLVASVTPQQMANVNIFSGKLKSVSDANITDNSWNLLADPARLPCYVHGFLDGSTGPRTRTFEPFGTQGVKISLEHDFACGPIDFRGAYRNPGALPAQP